MGPRWPATAAGAANCGTVRRGCPVRTLTELRAILDKGQAGELDGDRRQNLLAQFSSTADKLMARETQAADSRRKAHISSLTEEIRQLLTQAAVRDLFDEEDMPLDFSDLAYERLKRHKYPFSGALKQVGDRLPRPRPEDSFYLKMKASKRDVLTRRFDAIRTRLGDRLHQLVAAKGGAEPGKGDSEPAATVPTITSYASAGHITG